MIVVDTNVIAYLFFTGTHTQEARAAYLRDSQWCVPQLWRSEFRSVLSLYLRKNQISPGAAAEMMREAEGIVEGREYRVSTPDILALVCNSTCSAYDCEFVALAKFLMTSLVTSDKQVLRAFPGVAVSLLDFTKAV